MERILTTLSARMRDPRPQTSGERSLLYAYLCIFVLGGWICFTTVSNLMNIGSPIRAPRLIDVWALIAGGTGAALGLRFCARFFGYGGAHGFARAAWGGVAVSLSGSIIAGTFVMPLYGTMFGPLALLTTLWAHKMLALFWLMIFIGIHLQFGQWRIERDTIFHPRRSGTPGQVTP